MLRKILIILALFLVGCANGAAAESGASRETDLMPVASADVMNGEKNSKEDASAVVDDQLREKREEELYDRGWEIITNERPGGIHLSMLEKDVVRILGEPEKKTDAMFSDATGSEMWEADYVKIGLKLGYEKGEMDENYVSRVWWITIYSDVFDGSTDKGIRIGSTRQEIFDAYKDDIDYEVLRMSESYRAERLKGGKWLMMKVASW
ncbi:MAG: hypothetical protein FWH15_00535 [Betaproteobacteria bacterium]|nr:hypothetical protein [Betaproteobacteria bacterium]